MKKKKIGSIIIVVAFISIICVSNLAWYFTKDIINATNYENRTLLTRPEFRLDEYSVFADEYTNYFNDNIPFRTFLISLNSIVDYYVYDRLKTDEVITGNNNWLFYNRTWDGNPIGCYLGTNLYSEEELQNVANNIIKENDYLKSQGKEFVLFIAPNKERIYNDDILKKYGEPSEIFRAKQLINYLRENSDVRVVFPYEELIEAKNNVDYNIWYKTDTHWNFIGGYVGAAALLDELGIEMPDITSSELNIIKKENIAGDLANMVSLQSVLKYTDYEYEVTGYNNHNVEALGEDLDGGYRTTGADGRRIMIVRDSFSISMAPYIGSQFEETKFVHDDAYSNENYYEFDPDIVVWEAVERYIDNLGKIEVPE